MKESANKKGLLNLGKLEDVAEYLLDPNAAGGGYTSASESEVETDAEVEVLETSARKVTNRRQFESSANRDDDGLRRENHGVEKRAIKLIELGPRMKLRMTKVEEGVCTGRVMWHEYLTKSKEEVEQMECMWETRRQEREERKKVQRENVERKRKPNPTSMDEVDEDLEMIDEDAWDSDGLDNT
jgi:ribosome biogenesis protein SSF1/2